ncbi:glutathione S-transferase 1-like [Neocloeon triangulifer]|uniref:glutathione S-transferase 1-like n=1 Tax=Neocloeon triangulifer TaxID=2078957 RepID=UPI00286EC22B|nr:glutathione S-transferase 1-like [Neocloeon triangulifer]XP_059478223.1 glutathione S-transferase 1-like [Neocloeon triangulifer]XP_059478224.1 glutathione S-transferase 1-like [Neocloeon triangulifer]
MPLDLYCVDPSPPTRAVYLCLKILGLEANKKPISLFKREHLTPEYLKINPQHTVPTLVDDGFVIWDSHAICTYLIGKYGKDDSLYPKDLQKRAIIDQRLHFDTGMLFTSLFQIAYPLIFLKCKEIPKEKQQRARDAYAMLEKFLDGNDYLAGNNYTLADICCVSTTTTLVEAFRVHADDFPNVKAWIQRCKDNIPGYQETIQPGLNIYKGLVDAELN